MIFGTIILVLLAGVAFYHYVQGFFSAMISAVVAIMAACLAISYHEPLAEGMLAGVMPNYAHGVALTGLFAISYVVLRLLSDRLVPGNIRLPVLADKIAAGACGVVAGVFATGILAISAQLLPLGPDIAGYSRYDGKDREIYAIKLPGKYQKQDILIHNELEDETFDPKRANALFPLSTDAMTLGLVSHVSDGSLAGTQPLSSVHPSYLDQAFAHRTGPSDGADVIMGKDGGVDVTDIYTKGDILATAQDFELKELRGDKIPQITPDPDAMAVIIRMTVEGSSKTFSPSQVRLVIAGENYFPVGTYQRGEVMLKTRLDDVLVANGAADLVFFLPMEKLVQGDASGAKSLPRGSFIEVKRGARASVAGMDIAESPKTDSSKVGVVEKQALPQY